MNDSKILITGKTGTVGSNLKDGIGFSSSEFDLRDFSETEKLIRKTQPASIIHCAARVGGLGEHLRYKKELFYDNMLINMNVLEAARKSNVQRVLSFLSSCIYSDLASQPYNELNIHDSEPFEAHYPYGYSKRMLEVQRRIYYEQYGLKYNCVIPTNIYGLYDDFNIETGHVIGVLIHKCFLAVKNNTDFKVWGDGSQEREFLYSEDVAKLAYWALENYYDKEPVVFSNDQTVKIKEIAEIIADTFKLKGNIIFETDKPSGQKSRKLSGNKLKKLNNFEFTPIDVGIQKTINWFVENYKGARK
jgi:GDP-L-fucose synthase